MTSSRIAVLLVNTGTPDEPTVPAVRAYLKRYLSDRRIVEMPRSQWYPILYGMVLPRRPKRSAEKYRKVWTDEGSPLAVHGRRLAEGLAKSFEGEPVEVTSAMCYGTPSVEAEIKRIAASGIEKLLVLPLFPQYSPQTAGSVMDNVGRAYLTVRDQPALRSVKRYWDRSGWSEAVADSIRESWREKGDPFSCGGRLILSYHGVPEECVKEKGDRYQEECLASSRAVVSCLGLEDGTWETCFQSKFGPHEWLQPYTFARAEALGREGCPRLDLVCPSFSCDCLETLEEIEIDIRSRYLGANPAGVFNYIPCLNGTPRAVRFYRSVILEELKGWL